MAKLKEEKLVVSVVDKLISGNVNSACWFFFHQPKLPEGIRRYHKKIK